MKKILILLVAAAFAFNLSCVSSSNTNKGKSSTSQEIKWPNFSKMTDDAKEIYFVLTVIQVEKERNRDKLIKVFEKWEETTEVLPVTYWHLKGDTLQKPGLFFPEGGGYRIRITNCEEVSEYYKKARELAPKNATLYLNECEALFRSEDENTFRAKDLLLDLMTKFNADPTGWTYKGRDIEQREDLDKKLIEGLLSLSAKMKPMEGGMPVALELCRGAVKIYPKNAMALNALGTTLYFSGSKKEGIATLNNAYNLDPTNSTIMNNLGALYEDSGNYKTALYWYEKVEKEANDDDLKQEATKAIARIKEKMNKK